MINDDTVAYFSASYQNGSPEIHFNMDIFNIALFGTNSAEIKADFEDFKNTVLKIIKRQDIIPVVNTVVHQ